MAVAYNGGVVIGADSRTTMGSYIVRLVDPAPLPLTFAHLPVFRARRQTESQTS